MKLTLYSEDFKDGRKVDWPAVPRVGEFVSFNYRGGTTTLSVDRIEYACDAESNVTEIDVHLTY
ncbi:MAG: hypothetical protein M9895_05105 [Aquamicrobium sp.]|uniref:hypothetical protein n=1 Tax=Aquamicrobium sp. TaxID=1872579 RepID=UPI00349E7F2A|nr:hypothetical protein [Aquamicrobium sp.]MCO5158969.1 hypothetical protein [Aquamicrobium sp.]